MTWTRTFEAFIRNEQLTEGGSIFTTFTDLSDRAFGVAFTDTAENERQFRLAAQSAGYTTMRVAGEMVTPQKKQDGAPAKPAPTRTPTVATVVVGTSKTEPIDIRKFLFQWTERFAKDAFLFKTPNDPQMYIAGVSEAGWPGRHIMRPLGVFTPDQFIPHLRRLMGRHFEFTSLT